MLQHVAVQIHLQCGIANAVAGKADNHPKPYYTVQPPLSREQPAMLIKTHDTGRYHNQTLPMSS